MMKKTLLMMAVAAGMTLPGCVKNETTNGPGTASKICFEAPAVTGITRSALVPGEMENPYDQNEHFSVYALYFAGGTYTNFASGTLFMRNVETAYNAGGQYWDSESVAGGQPYYWPKTGSLTFGAYSPTGAADDCTVDWGATGFTFTDFTVPNDPAKHYDLLFSERSYNRTASTGGTNYNGVDINFKHALSAVVFKVRVGATYAGHTITLKNIALKNTFTKGNFNQNLEDTNNAETGGTTPASWTGQNTENTAGYTVFNGTEEIASTEAAEPVDATRLIVLPQELAHSGANNVSIDVTYSVHNGTAEIDQTTEIDISQGYGLTEFEIGKRYIFTLIIDLDKITFSPEVNDWTDVTVTPDIEL